MVIQAILIIYKIKDYWLEDKGKEELIQMSYREALLHKKETF